MLKSPFCAAAAVLVASAASAFAQESQDTNTNEAEMVRKGAQAYRMCAACHSLKPDMHLSGPSLSGLWGKEAATIEDYDRYTGALKDLEVIWDENTLNPWLAHPQEMAPGTTMTYRGVENDQTRMALIEFLRVAMAEGGHEKVVEKGLIPESMAEGQIPPDLTRVEANQRVTEIRRCRDAYYVTTADGARFPFWETNVRLKIDTSERGPGQGDPVLLRSGMAGDRVSVVFASLTHLRKTLDEKCD